MLKHIDKSKSILDLGKSNILSRLLIKEGYNIRNTFFDLDEHPTQLYHDVVTGFEILEHLIEPAQVLKHINCNEAVFSVPIPRLFEKTYWNWGDRYDQHFHEFHPMQFDKLLNHCGWEISNSEKWRSYSSFAGWLLLWEPKHYIVHIGRRNEKA